MANRFHVMSWLVFAAVVGALPAGSALADVSLVSGALTGKVVEVPGGTSVGGAVVVAIWKGGYSGAGHGGARCARAAAVAADADGTFAFPPWTMRHPDLQGLQVEVTAHHPKLRDGKRGLTGVPRRMVLGLIPMGSIEIPPTTMRVEMVPFQGDDRERADYLLRFLSSTDCADGDVSQVIPFYAAIRAEIAGMPPAVRLRTGPGGYTYTLLELIDQGYINRPRR